MVIKVGEIKVTWLGHAAFMIDYDVESTRIIIDPFLGASPLKPNEIKDVDLILVTHAHEDHVGATCDILKNNKDAKVVAIYELAEHIGKECNASENMVGMNIGGTWIFKKGAAEIPITQVQAMHSSMGIGSATGFVIRFPEFSVYHSGDTGVFASMEIIGRLYNVRLALLPIGSHFTMGIDEAVEAVKLLKPEYVIPMHYDTWPIIKADPKLFKEKVEATTSTKVIILKPGESKNFVF